METPTLFERLGGQEALNSAVDIFYRRVLADDRVNHFFHNVDMDKQNQSLKRFLAMAFGGPNNYTGNNLRVAHRRISQNGLNDQHVDIIIEHLGSTLNALGARSEDIAEVAAIANSVRDDILDR